MELSSISKQIDDLFMDIPAFAQLAAGLSIEDYQPKQFDFFDYPLGVSWLGIPKGQADSLQMAFAALFLLDLHYQNDWIYNETQRTNADQFVIDRLPAGQWKSLLEHKWIPEYFGLSRRRLKTTPVAPSRFAQVYLCWKPENADAAAWSSLESLVSSVQWVVSLFPDTLYFGETAEYYFFAESDVYD